ncbi:MAG: competence/damage-inducible protein A [Eubacteriaceae bacterium]|nr:competence/damage-inducible protein A [Eubacteriaceae bacterium]MDD4507456.1 competence/damage-inducible protein A [Eubacteriaceae bacterium]
MNCEIICIGTELLTGDTLNTNVNYISKHLSKNGFSVLYQTTIGDNPERLQQCFKIAAGRSDIVILTGGLGPTQDDLTKETIADFFSMPMKRNEKQVRNMKNHFDRYNYVMTDNNFRQCDIPVGAKAIDNTRGTAPGIHIEKEGLSVFLLPGPPSEMSAMFDLYVMPILKNRIDQLVISRYFNVCDLGESMVEDTIMDLVSHQNNPTIATYAKLGEVLIRITANGKDAKQLNERLDQYESVILKRFGDHIFTKSQRSLNQVVGKMLLDRHLTLASAESCTGGLIASKLTEIAGISDAFKMGLVTYSNEAKEKMLHVNKMTLEKKGAVSSETAREMCEHLKSISGCDLAVSVTGIAGPDGGTPKKPVGLVYIGVCGKNECYIEKCRFNGNRQTIQQKAAQKTFVLIRKMILDISENHKYN